jgi:tetratricopeptide (TPR) repeat protein
MIAAYLRFALPLLAAGVWALGVVPARAGNLPDFDKLWNWSDPSATEAKFRAILPGAEVSGNADYLGQLLTQIARSQGLQGRIDDAHQTLDRVEKMLNSETKTAHVRYLLERGRLFRSSKKIERSKSNFVAAWELGRAADLDELACDAAHMMGVIEGGERGIEWNLKAIDLAEHSTDPKVRVWLGVLYRNTGWYFLDKGDSRKALEMFEKGLAWHRERKDPATKILVAKWRIGRALRSLGRIDEALSTQREVESGYAAVGQESGFVLEEIGECLYAQGKPTEAKPYFAKAYALLKEEAASGRIDAKRLERMEVLGGGSR